MGAISAKFLSKLVNFQTKYSDRIKSFTLGILPCVTRATITTKDIK